MKITRTIRKSFATMLASVFALGAIAPAFADEILAEEVVAIQEFMLLESLMDDVGSMYLEYTGVQTFLTVDEYGNAAAIQVGILPLEEFEMLQEQIFNGNVFSRFEIYHNRREVIGSFGYNVVWYRFIGSSRGDITIVRMVYIQVGHGPVFRDISHEIRPPGGFQLSSISQFNTSGGPSVDTSSFITFRSTSNIPLVRNFRARVQIFAHQNVTGMHIVGTLFQN